VDIIEEILRIYGFDNIKFPSQIKSTINASEKVNPTAVKNKIADYLAANGYNEMMGLSMSQSRYYKEILPVPEEQLVLVNNTANVELDCLRPSMLFAGLEAIVRNQNRQYSDLRLFEFGKSYIKKSETEYIEDQHLTLFVTGKKFAESWLATDKDQVSIYTLKNMVVRLLQRLGIENAQETTFADERFSTALRLHRGQQVLVEFGKLHSNISKKMDIKNNVYYADFQWDTLLKALQKHKIVFEDMSKYPIARRDLALVIEKNVNFADVVAIARKTVKQNLKEINLFDVYENETQLGVGKKSYAVSFIFEDKEKTLEDKQIDANMNALIKQYEERIGALIRK
jgi:phenylalanyl-tRNA synthetase beta chain